MKFVPLVLLCDWLVPSVYFSLASVISPTAPSHVISSSPAFIHQQKPVSVTLHIKTWQQQLFPKDRLRPARNSWQLQQWNLFYQFTRNTKISPLLWYARPSAHKNGRGPLSYQNSAQDLESDLDSGNVELVPLRAKDFNPGKLSMHKPSWKEYGCSASSSASVFTNIWVSSPFSNRAL